MPINSKINSCDTPSKAIDSFLQIVRTDNYVIHELDLEQLVIHHDTGKIIVAGSNIISFKAKRNFKIPNLDENYYPGFEIHQICIDQNASGEKLKNEILHTVKSRNFNLEKEYDYIVDDGEMLIYVVTRAKIFKEYAFRYQVSLEELIKN